MAGNYLSSFTFFYILLILPLELLVVLAVNDSNCSYSNCASNLYPKDHISYPFRTPDQPKTCGLPGFDLGCNPSDRTPLLSFPSGQSFTVEDIYYSFKTIWIDDPQGCLAEKLLYLNTSGTPFSVDTYRSTDFTHYSCPSLDPLPPANDANSVCSTITSCGRSGPPYSIVCVSAYSLQSDIGCKLIGGVRVPGTWTPYQFTSDAYVVELIWIVPECLQCGRKDVITIVTVATVLITLAAVSCIYCKCRKRRQNRSREGSGGAANATSAATERSSVASGVLGQDTLDAYPIMVVGESGRMLIVMDEKTCPVCLSDYASKDTIKMLPECLHRFHADCIDEWLRAKPTCPICRTPPPRRSSS